VANMTRNELKEFFDDEWVKKQKTGFIEICYVDLALPSFDSEADIPIVQIDKQNQLIVYC
jgi:hypothetical protein